MRDTLQTLLFLLLGSVAITVVIIDAAPAVKQKTKGRIFAEYTSLPSPVFVTTNRVLTFPTSSVSAGAPQPTAYSTTLFEKVTLPYSVAESFDIALPGSNGSVILTIPGGSRVNVSVPVNVTLAVVNDTVIEIIPIPGNLSSLITTTLAKYQPTLTIPVVLPYHPTADILVGSTFVTATAILETPTTTSSTSPLASSTSSPSSAIILTTDVAMTVPTTVFNSSPNPTSTVYATAFVQNITLPYDIQNSTGETTVNITTPVNVTVAIVNNTIIEGIDASPNDNITVSVSSPISQGVSTVKIPIVLPVDATEPVVIGTETVTAVAQIAAQPTTTQVTFSVTSITSTIPVSTMALVATPVVLTAPNATSKVESVLSLIAVATTYDQPTVIVSTIFSTATTDTPTSTFFPDFTPPTTTTDDVLIITTDLAVSIPTSVVVEATANPTATVFTTTLLKNVTLPFVITNDNGTSIVNITIPVNVTLAAANGTVIEILPSFGANGTEFSPIESVVGPVATSIDIPVVVTIDATQEVVLSSKTYGATAVAALPTIEASATTADTTSSEASSVKPSISEEATATAPAVVATTTDENIIVTTDVVLTLPSTALAASPNPTATVFSTVVTENITLPFVAIDNNSTSTGMVVNITTLANVTVAVVNGTVIEILPSVVNDSQVSVTSVLGRAEYTVDIPVVVTVDATQDVVIGSKTLAATAAVETTRAEASTDTTEVQVKTTSASKTAAPTATAITAETTLVIPLSETVPSVSAVTTSTEKISKTPSVVTSPDTLQTLDKTPTPTKTGTDGELVVVSTDFVVTLPSVIPTRSARESLSPEPIFATTVPENITLPFINGTETVNITTPVNVTIAVVNNTVVEIGEVLSGEFSNVVVVTLTTLGQVDTTVDVPVVVSISATQEVQVGSKTYTVTAAAATGFDTATASVTSAAEETTTIAGTETISQLVQTEASEVVTFVTSEITLSLPTRTAPVESSNKPAETVFITTLVENVTVSYNVTQPLDSFNSSIVSTDNTTTLQVNVTSPVNVTIAIVNDTIVELFPSPVSAAGGKDISSVSNNVVNVVTTTLGTVQVSNSNAVVVSAILPVTATEVVIIANTAGAESPTGTTAAVVAVPSTSAATTGESGAGVSKTQFFSGSPTISVKTATAPGSVISVPASITSNGSSFSSSKVRSTKTVTVEVTVTVTESASIIQVLETLTPSPIKATPITVTRNETVIVLHTIYPQANANATTNPGELSFIPTPTDNGDNAVEETVTVTVTVTVTQTPATITHIKTTTLKPLTLAPSTVYLDQNVTITKYTSL